MSLTELVIETIKVDFSIGNYEPLETMLDQVPHDVLLAYLPEDVGQDFLNEQNTLTNI
jgi:hypothetical protein